jgi:amidase
LLGIKPTVGIVPQRYIIPISLAQDIAGPMTTMGAVLMMNAIAISTPGKDYNAGLTKNALKMCVREY